MRFRSIRTKIAAFTGAALLLAVGAVTLYAAVTVWRSALASAEKESRALAEEHAGQIEAELEAALNSAQTLANALSATKDPAAPISLDRNQVLGMTRALLLQNQTLLGTYTLWEPNAFDGQDAKFVNATGHDQTGRFIPYVVRSGATVSIEPLKDYENQTRDANGLRAGEYYLCPRDAKAECVVEPYLYPIAGVDTLLTSFTAPILNQGRFYGIAGVDLTVGFLQKIADDANLAGGTGRLLLLSPKGLVAGATGQRGWVGKPVREALPKAADRILGDLSKGQSFAAIDGETLRAFAPVHIGRTAPWGVDLEIPVAAVTGEARAAMQQMLLIGLVALLAGIGLLWLVTGSIVRPVRRAVEAVLQVAEGDCEVEVDASGTDEIGDLGRALQTMVTSQQAMAGAADAVGRGDLSVAVQPRSDRDLLAKALVAMIRSIRGVVGDVQKLSQAAMAGQLSTRADATQHQGEFQQIVEGVNGTLDSVIAPLHTAADYLERISKGQIPEAVREDFRGDFNAVKQSLDRVICAVRALSDDAQMLSSAAVEGRLGARADASRHEGDFRRIVEGVNATLDAVLGPLQVAAKCVDDISKGRIPPKISAPYRGEFATLKDNLNTCIDAVNALIRDVQTLSSAALEGRLSARADATRHGGDFRRIVEGVNATLDAVTGPLGLAAASLEKISKGEIPPPITEDLRGDFGAVKASLNRCIDAVNALVADARRLSTEALAGRLSTRADASRHGGDFRKVVEGVNATLDAVIGPVNDATQVLQALAGQDLCARVTGDYSGDHAKIKDAVNATADSLHDAMGQVARSVEALAGSSREVASTSQSVSQGASEQASALEETTRNLEQMASMTHSNADHTQEAHKLAQTAKSAADGGSESMGRMSQAMERIRRSSEGTAAIIRDINENRLPDQPPGPQRRGRGGARRRCRTGLRGGGRRGALAGPAGEGGRAEDREPDPGVGPPRQRRRRPGRDGGDGAGRHRQHRGQGQRPGGGDRLGEQGAVSGHRADQARHRADGQRHPARRRQRRGALQRGGGDVRAVAVPGRPRLQVQARPGQGRLTARESRSARPPRPERQRPAPLGGWRRLAWPSPHLA
ncbi:MAG: HAMP domain-containing protein [Myxococcales bacterium]